MAAKARLFDETALHCTMSTSNSSSYKCPGRDVCHFDNYTWGSARGDIVLCGTSDKFAKNAIMRNSLLATGDRIVAKASPYDRVWGVALKANDPDILEPEQWPGLTVLGKILQRE